MKTVEEILKESGLTDEQIKALDAKVVSGLTTVVTSSNSDLEKSELARRAQQQQYDQVIAPALDGWANEKANLEAQTNYYKTLAEKAKEGGFLPGTEPFKPPVAAAARDEGGKFVAGDTGSPKFVENLRMEAATAISTIMDVQWRYQSLYGKPMPDSPTALIKEASDNRMPTIQYIAKKYDFAGKEAAMAADAKKKETDAAVAAALAENDKKWAEKVGSNPDVRRAEASKFSEINKAVKAGTRPDPLKMTEQERDASTRRNIQAEVTVQ
jgi:hypothetical protein